MMAQLYCESNWYVFSNGVTWVADRSSSVRTASGHRDRGNALSALSPSLLLSPSFSSASPRLSLFNFSVVVSLA